LRISNQATLTLNVIVVFDPCHISAIFAISCGKLNRQWTPMHANDETDAWQVGIARWGSLPVALDSRSFAFIRGFDPERRNSTAPSGSFLFRQERHEVRKLRVRQSVLQSFRHDAQFQRSLLLDLILLERVRLALRIA
jgi:hypothetical protein